MLDGNVTVRVYNKCKHDIGVILLNGLGTNIKVGGFAIMTVNDVLYIESSCTYDHFFTEHMLVATDFSGKEIALEEFGFVFSDSNPKVHLNDEEISAKLNQSLKKMSAWLEEIEEPSELHAIYLVAKQMNLTHDKIKALKGKMPDKDWLDEM